MSFDRKTRCSRSLFATAGTTKPSPHVTTFLRRIRSIRVRQFALMVAPVQRRRGGECNRVQRLRRRENHGNPASGEWHNDQLPTVVAPSVASKPAPAPMPPAGPAPTGWGWPSNGILIGKFSSNGSLNKGIDIAGDLGQPVLAASDGTVVYAGSGLRGYGELVIIKHSDTYVSAYGHNRRLLVREGQQVKVGQTIAEMGSTGTDRVKLHFEIRRQGKPVDPLQFLPRR